MALSVTRCTHQVCSGTWGGYLCFLVPCHGGSRFPALPYTAVFNVGVLTAGLVRRLSEGHDSKDRAAFLAAFSVFCMPFAYAYLVKIRSDTTQGVSDTLLKDKFLEHMSAFEITRIPPTPAWLFATLGVGLVVFLPCITAGIAIQHLQEGYYPVRVIQ